MVTLTLCTIFQSAGSGCQLDPIEHSYIGNCWDRKTGICSDISDFNPPQSTGICVCERRGEEGRTVNFSDISILGSNINTHPVHFKLYSLEFTVYSLHCALCIVQCTLYKVNYLQSVYIVQCSICSVQYTLHSDESSVDSSSVILSLLNWQLTHSQSVTFLLLQLLQPST